MVATASWATEWASADAISPATRTMLPTAIDVPSPKREINQPEGRSKRRMPSVLSATTSPATAGVAPRCVERSARIGMTAPWPVANRKLGTYTDHASVRMLMVGHYDRCIAIDERGSLMQRRDPRRGFLAGDRRLS